MNCLDQDGGLTNGRFDSTSLNGLRNKHREVETPEVSEKAITMIRKVLLESQSGWMAKEVMNLIYERTGVKYHEVHIYRLFSPKVPRMRSVSAASKQDKSRFRKRLEA